MRLQILHVPDCPGAEALDTRLAPLLALRPDIQVIRQVVTTDTPAQMQAGVHSVQARRHRDGMAPGDAPHLCGPSLDAERVPLAAQAWCPPL